MATTAVVAEILIAGLQTAVWITLLVLAIFGAGWLDPSELESWTALLTLLVFAGAYMLGVLIDRAADSLALWLSGIFRLRQLDKPEGIDQMRLRLLREDNGVSKFVDYQRSRMRVARATVFNLLLLGPVLVFFLIRQADAAPSVIAGTAVAAVLATVGAYMAYRRTESAYIRILSHAYRVAEGIPQAEIAAAVCYRWRDGELEFCVVQTEDGKRWTFPKGHREEDETLPEAARREAREEAGITGPVDGQRLHTYRYPPSREGLTDDDVVAAYLLKVKGTTVPKEDRTPHWCGIDELRRKLAQRRLRRYVVEIDPVINAAARAAATRKPGRSRRIRTGGSWVQVSEN